MLACLLAAGKLLWLSAQGHGDKGRAGGGAGGQVRKGTGATLTTLVFTPRTQEPSSELLGTGRAGDRSRGLVRRLLHQPRQGDSGFGPGGSREQVRRSRILYLF